ncbi:hypothetical protein AB0L67_41720, partial [Streptomyces flaveolus]|uniref:hypothetical protein n=1 Tax=Streptomyces flaveolus TaxID=67297 RepID=UPI0034359CE0
LHPTGPEHARAPHSAAKPHVTVLPDDFAGALTVSPRPYPCCITCTIKSNPGVNPGLIQACRKSSLYVLPETGVAITAGPFKIRLVVGVLRAQPAIHMLNYFGLDCHYPVPQVWVLGNKLFQARILKIVGLIVICGINSTMSSCFSRTIILFLLIIFRTSSRCNAPSSTIP